MSEPFEMNEPEQRTSEKLIQRARDAIAAIALEEVVVALHRRFECQWQWDAFKKRLAESEKEPANVKVRP